jgi:hypothetical protein
MLFFGQPGVRRTVLGCRSPYILALLFWLMPSAQAAHAEDLLWGVVPIPGAFNVRDGKIIDGWMYEGVQLLAERLPDLHMRYEVLPHAAAGTASAQQ